MDELFKISDETMEQLSDIRSSLECSDNETQEVENNNSCTCCWGGWCANGCSG